MTIQGQGWYQCSGWNPGLVSGLVLGRGLAAQGSGGCGGPEEEGGAAGRGVALAEGPKGWRSAWGPALVGGPAQRPLSSVVVQH